jgi:hypothetical protein
MQLSWARSIVEQCQAAGVSCFVKQLGAFPVEETNQSAADLLFPKGVPAGASISGFSYMRRERFLQDSKGGDWDEWPSDLRVRQFPAADRV